MLHVLNHILTSVENRIGGGEGIMGVYGSITCASLNHVLQSMHLHCGLGPDSILFDFGAGLGRPSLHALGTRYACKAWGVEFDSVKVTKAHTFIDLAVRRMRAHGIWPPLVHATEVQLGDTSSLRSLEDTTHVFAFWEGIPRASRVAMAQVFQKSSHVRGIVVCQRAILSPDTPLDFMNDLGFNCIQLKDSFPVIMAQSGQMFRAYVFKCMPKS